MAKWPLDGKPACFFSFCLGAAAVWDGSCALPSFRPRHCATGSPDQACMPGCRVAALQHRVMVDA